MDYNACILLGERTLIMKFFNILESPIKIDGLAVVEQGRFHRLPDDVINNVNEGVTGLAKQSAGACVRFRTDSPVVFVKVTLISGGCMNHMPLSGQSGVDIYIDGQYISSIRPDSSQTVTYEGTAVLPVIFEKGVLHDVRINLPLYNGITDMQIGVDDGFQLESPSPYTIEKPIVFYGSSITQGGCASKPGNAYCSMLARWLDAAHINLGFSGSARGEESIGSYIASLSMSVFVLDYDHNAPSIEHLQNTHARFFNQIRSAQLDLPIVIVSKPDFDLSPIDNTKRRSIINETYNNAINAGDTKVWFVDGEMLFGTHDRGACTVDGCHPNDLGFYRMAETIYPILRKILK